MGTEIGLPQGKNMHFETGRPEATNVASSRRIDKLSVFLALATLVIVGWTAWMRFAPSPRPDPPAVGSALPPLPLIDLETSEPLVLLGLKGKVVWVVFWSAGTPSGDASLTRMDSVWKRLKADRRFSLVAAAVNSKDPQRVLDVLAKNHSTLPAYLAGPETCRRFGAGPADPPLHLLCDAQGRIAAITRGGGQGTIDRLEAQVQSWLEELDPMGNTRFAMNCPKDVVAMRAPR